MFSDSREDAKGDCKSVSTTVSGILPYWFESVGDFGLATSSLAAVDPTDKSPHIGLLDDLTLGELDILDIHWYVLTISKQTLVQSFTWPLKRRPTHPDVGPRIKIKPTCIVWELVHYQYLSSPLKLTPASDCILWDELFLLNWSWANCSPRRFAQAGDILSKQLGCAPRSAKAKWDNTRIFAQLLNQHL